MKRSPSPLPILTASFLACAYLAHAQDPSIAEFSGNGIRNTRPFDTPGPWEITWSASGDIFQIYVYGEGGDLVGVAANQQGPGDGSSYQAKGGRYYLQINTIGDWSVEVALATASSESDSDSGGTLLADRGNGAKTTRPFRSEGPWEISWDASGDIFQIYVYGEGGDLVGVAANQQWPGDGTSYQARGGKYYLQINAIGDWSMEVAVVTASSESDSDSSGALLIDRGNGAKTTRPFRSEGPWEISWDASGDIFQIFVYRNDGTLAGVASNQSGAATGSSYQATGGEFYLQVNALGEWQIKVVRIE
jgi:hypothetical protein